MYNHFDLDTSFENPQLGLEARNILKEKTLRLQTSQFFIADKSFTDPVCIFSFANKYEDTLSLYSDILKRRSNMLVPKLKTYYMDKFIVLQKITASTLRSNLQPQYMAITKLKKEYNVSSITNIKKNINSSFSTIVDMSFVNGLIYNGTIRKNLMVTEIIRRRTVDYYIKYIKEFNSTVKNGGYKNNVLYFRYPFFTDTDIKLSLIQDKLKRIFKPFIFFLELLAKDKEAFKKFIVENNISLVFEGKNKKSLVISKNDKLFNNPNFNFRFIMKTLHIIDGITIDELNKMESEDGLEGEITSKEEYKSIDAPVEIADNAILDESSDVINEDELEQFFSDKEEITEEEIETINRKQEELEADVIDIMMDTDATVEIGLDEDVVGTPKLKTKDYFSVIEQEIPEEDKVNQILEIHNYTDLKESLETKEVKKLRDKMNKSYGRELSEVVTMIKNTTIPTTEYDIGVSNSYSKGNFVNYENTYIEKLNTIDQDNIMCVPSKMSNPFFIKDKKVKKVRDSNLYGNRTEVTYVNQAGKEFKVVLNIPEVIDGKVFYKGSYKEIAKQDAGKPIYKVGHNVIVASSYKKTILQMVGKYGSTEQKAIITILKNYNDPCIRRKTTLELGDSIFKNLTHYNLSNLRKHIAGFGKPNVNIDFSGLRETTNLTTEEAAMFTSGYTTVLGNVGPDLVFHNPEDDTYAINTDKYESTTDFVLKMLKYFNEEEYNKAMKATPAKITTTGVNRVVASIMQREIPVILLLLVATPFNTLLKRLKEENGLEYIIIKNNATEKLAKYKNNIQFGIVRLRDYTIVLKYNNTVNQILLVPLTELEILEEYTAFDITKLMSSILGSANTATYIENFIEGFFVDPMVSRVLAMYNMPTDFVGVFIYACALFTSHKTFYESDTRNYRLVTASETINRCLSELIITAFTDNMKRNKMGSSDRIVISEDDLIGRLDKLPNIKEAARFNPFRAMAEDHKKSFKGHYGINMSRAYNMNTRMFNPENLGTETFHTPYSAEAGISKTLPVNPQIQDLTGAYVHIPLSEADNTPVSSLVSFVESYIPYLSHDHVHRQMMTPAQVAGHVLPIKDGDPMLISSGADESSIYNVPDFSYISKGPGKVLEINEKYIKIQYDKDNFIDIISLDNIMRNTDKGYFLKNDWIPAEDLKVGKKIKKSQIIAYNKDWYKKKPNGQLGLSFGCYAHILIGDGETTWEDANLLFTKISKKLKTDIIKPITKVIPIDSEIRNWNVSLGSEVVATDILYSYKALTDDININQYFIGAEDLDLKDVKAKYKGTIAGIEINFRRSKEKEMSKSIKDYLGKVSKEINAFDRSASLEDVSDEFKRNNLDKKPRELKGGQFSKIYGSRIENGEMLVTYFIKTTEEVGPADKIVIDRALKGEPCMVLPNEMRPIGSISKRKIDMVMNTYSFLARITPGMLMHSLHIQSLFYIAIRNRKLLGIEIEDEDILNYIPSFDMVK